MRGFDVKSKKSMKKETSQWKRRLFPKGRFGETKTAGFVKGTSRSCCCCCCQLPKRQDGLFMQLSLSKAEQSIHLHDTRYRQTRSMPGQKRAMTKVSQVPKIKNESIENADENVNIIHH